MQRTLLAAVLLAGFLAGAVGISILLIRGAGSADPLSAIPAGAEAVIAIPSAPDLMRGLARSRRAEANAGDDWDLAASLVGELSDARGLTVQPEGARMARSLRGGAAIGLLHSARHASSPDLIVAVELESRDDALLSWFEASVVPSIAGGDATSTRRTHRGLEYLVVKARGTGVHLCVAVVGRLAIATTTRAGMEESLSALLGHAPSISSSPSFRGVQRDIGRHAALLAFVTKPFIERAIRGESAGAEASRAGWRRAAEEAHAEAAAVSIRVDADGLFREQARIWIPDMSETLLGRLFRGRPRPIAAAEELPEGFALYAGAAFGDLAPLGETLPSWLGPALGQDPESLRDRLAGLQDFLDSDFRRDFLTTMGVQVAIAADPGVSRSAVVALEPTDAAATKRLLHRLDGLARAGGAYRGPGEESSGVTTYALPGGLSPSYLVSGSSLLVGASPDALATLRGRRRHGDRIPRAEGPLAFDPPAHVVLAVDTELALGWLRRHAPSRKSVSSEAWLRKIADLLPVASEPLPRTRVRFVVTRDGISAEWISPASPTLLTALIWMTPGPEAPEADDAGPIPPAEGSRP
ncbi:MAG: DUF3352 domain-containing protein [Acidobacteria bacterium]|nr:DUF3352 domain-containing protein [Acidobacteriota bacterium]